MPSSGVPVWGLWIRAVHWAVAAIVVVDLLNEAGANPWHRNLGYAAAGLVALRLVAGAVLKGHANPGAMARAALRAPSYARAVVTGRSRPSLGHNPLGALLSFTIWALVLFLAVTGWMTQLDQFWGEEWLHDVHTVGAYALGVCAALHIVGVFRASRVYGPKVAMSMITGRKRLADAGGETRPTTSR
jgi:cytochrome b